MTNPPQGMRLCPTRAGDAPTLIAHTITGNECQKRQREHFHKCPTCVHHNARNVETPPTLVGVATASVAPKSTGA